VNNKALPTTTALQIYSDGKYRPSPQDKQLSIYCYLLWLSGQPIIRHSGGENPIERHNSAARVELLIDFMTVMYAAVSYVINIPPEAPLP